MKKKIFLFSGCCLFSLALQAQTIERAVISSGGAYIEQGAYSLSYTVSQTAVETATSANNILTQGFQQPEDFFTAVSEIKNESHDIQVFPNPFSGEVHINIISGVDEMFTVSLFDMLGSLVSPVYTMGSNTDNTVSFSRIPKGSYMLRVTSASQAKVIKIVKAAE